MTPTNNLRWKVQIIEMCDGPGGDIKLKILQQKWESYGIIEWRDVPEVEVPTDDDKQ